jgi:SPP1 family predicted phage head-tail adaptor
MSGLSAGRLRHRVRIEKPGDSRDPSTGEPIPGDWVLVADSVPAEIVALSVRDYLAAAQHQSQITARIVIRYRAGITSNMRCTDLATGTIYNIQAPLADPESGREYLTFPCSTGVNDG